MPGVCAEVLRLGAVLRLRLQQVLLQELVQPGIPYLLGLGMTLGGASISQPSQNDEKNIFAIFHCLPFCHHDSIILIILFPFLFVRFYFALVGKKTCYQAYLYAKLYSNDCTGEAIYNLHHMLHQTGGHRKLSLP